MAKVSSQAGDARDAEEIAEILYEWDIEEFVRGDWSTVAEDFASEPFVGYKGGESHDAPWEIGSSNLEVKHG